MLKIIGSLEYFHINVCIKWYMGVCPITRLSTFLRAHQKFCSEKLQLQLGINE